MLDLYHYILFTLNYLYINQWVFSPCLYYGIYAFMVGQKTGTMQSALAALLRFVSLMIKEINIPSQQEFWGEKQIRFSFRIPTERWPNFE